MLIEREKHHEEARCLSAIITMKESDHEKYKDVSEAIVISAR